MKASEKDKILRMLEQAAGAVCTVKYANLPRKYKEAAEVLRQDIVAFQDVLRTFYADFERM